MLQKHSKDIIFIVIILILIGIIWGVERTLWMFIAINVLVIMVCLLYINVTEGEVNMPFKKKNKENHYFSLKNIAEIEMDDLLTEVDYDDFESVKKGKEVLEKLNVSDSIDGVAEKIKKICNYDIEVYYLGLVAISYANTDQLKEIDYKYFSLGIKLVNSSRKIKTRLTNFLKDNNL